MNEEDRFSITDYFDESVFLRMKKLADTKETPFLIMDTETVSLQYDALVKNFPYASVYYAVKANPDPEVVSLLLHKGSCFDLASVYELARELGLVPYGIPFHVGSQQREIAAWDAALGKVSSMMEQLRAEHGIEVQMINMGGGLPANYLSRTNDLETYAGEILRYLEKYFVENLPSIIIEPGRSIVGNAGIIISEVVLISRKSRSALHRWVFTDVGKFSGLIETLSESIKYPIYTDRKGEVEEVILAGPTCDSADTMYEEYKYSLPLNLSPSDRLYWFSTGAYTRSYSAIEFNGFPPLAVYYV